MTILFSQIIPSYRGGVTFLHDNRREGCTVDAMNYAANNGHLDVVRFLHDNCKEGCTVEAMSYAVAYDTLMS
jgi:Ankyrin repeats (many copies)